MRNLTDPSTDPSLRRGPERRMVAIVLASAAAACLIIAALSQSWMGNPSFNGLVRDRDGRPTDAGYRYMPLAGDIRFGPTGFEHCEGRESMTRPSEVLCETISTSSFNELIGTLDPQNRDLYTSGAFSPAGWAAFVLCLLGAAALLGSAGLAYFRKQKELPISPASVALLALMGAMAAGCVFIATKPGPAGMLGVDLGFWAFGAGTVVGILGAQMLAKELRPPDPDLLEGALTPDDFSAFPIGRAAPAPAPAPIAPIPPTLPAEVYTDASGLDEALASAASDEAPAGAEPHAASPEVAAAAVASAADAADAATAETAPAGDADSPGDAEKPGGVSS